MDLYQICCCLLFQLLVFSQHCQGYLSKKSRQDVLLDQIEQAAVKLFRLEYSKHSKIPRQDLLNFAKLLQLDENTNITGKEGRFSLIPEFKNPGALCPVCYSISAKIWYLKENFPSTSAIATYIKEVMTSICNFYFKFHSLTLTTLCSDLLEINEPVLTYVIKNSQILSSELICSVLLQVSECYTDDIPALNWIVSLSEKPKNLQSFPPKDNKNLTKILHLSDFHISDDYAEGSVADCGLPVCCKKDLGNSNLPHNRAGKWGNAEHCDTPPELFQNTLEYIKQEHKDIQLVYFTGDIIDHQVWKVNKEHNIELITDVYKNLISYFPHLQLIPVIGNHESVPLNIYSPRDNIPEQFSQQWLYDTMADVWGKFLPSSTLETIKKQGYYTLLISPQLRIIALNNNLCYMWNWWLLYDTEFLKEQLEWLNEVLFEAEKNGELVHILGHVPTGNKECIKPWEKNYNRIISRFEHIISGQFVGHTHTDELKVFYNTETEEPNSVVFNGASLTPYTNYNPNYKIYTLNPITTEVIDQETFTFNLTLANEPYQKPFWYRLYSLREAFGLKDLSPNTIHELAASLTYNKTLFYDYYRFYVRDGDSSLKEGCNEECQKYIICQIVHTEFLVTNKKSEQYCSNYFKTTPWVEQVFG